MNGPYDDIIHLPHPFSRKHPQMSMEERAAQFSPFAALTGYGDVIRETARLTDPRQELTESRKEELNRRLLLLERCMERAAAAGSLLPEIAVTYFQPDDRKEGGACLTVRGRPEKLRRNRRVLEMEGGTEIPLPDILEIEGELFQDMEWE